MNEGRKLVEFERINDAPPRKRRSRVWTRGLPALFVVISLLGIVAASNLVVNQKTDTTSVYAERYSLTEQFTVGQSSVWVAKADRAASGVQGTPVELSAGLPEARSFLPTDQWVYSVPVTEASAGSVAGGNFTIELFVDELSVGKLFVTQQTADPAAIEGVTASFALGPIFSTSSLYYLVVKPFVQLGPTTTYTVESTPGGSLTWTGVGGAIDAQVNPTLTVPVGGTLRVTAQNADGITHDIGIKDASGTLVNPPGWSPDFESVGASQTIGWTPSAAGTYTYMCKYHASTMRGTITVGA